MGISIWKGHLCEEVAAVVVGVWVDDHKSDRPSHDIVILELNIAELLFLQTLEFL